MEQPKVILHPNGLRNEKRAELVRAVNATEDEFGILDTIKRALGLGKHKHDDEEEEGEEHIFDESKHPRGPDGRFVKANNPEEAGGLLPTLEMFPETKREITERRPKFKSGEKIDGISVDGSVVLSVKTKTGKTLSIYDDDTNNMSREDKESILNTMADLHERYPGKFKTTKVLLKSDQGTKNALDLQYSSGVLAWVNMRIGPGIGSQSRINFNADAFSRWKDYLSEDYKQRGVMPMENKVSPARWIMAHEMGHQFDVANNKFSIGPVKFYKFWATDKLHKNPNIRDHLSHYGQGHPAEGYAEAFADWHLSKGTTTNPASGAYAKHQKWTGSSSSKSRFDAEHIAFAGETDSEESGDLMILDTFDSEKGATYVNFPEHKEEPDSMEEARSEAIVRQVYAELGLPYKE